TGRSEASAWTSAHAKHTLIPLSEPTLWDATLAAVPHAFAHRWGHNNAFALSSGLPTFLYVYQSGGATVVCPLAERKAGSDHRDILTPYGFAGPSASGAVPGFAAEWRRFAVERGWVAAYLQGNPLLDNPLFADEPGQ